MIIDLKQIPEFLLEISRTPVLQKDFDNRV